jgi:hypothetical protein
VYEVKIRRCTGRLEKIKRDRYEFPAVTVVNVTIMVVWDVLYPNDGQSESQLLHCILVMFLYRSPTYTSPKGFVILS